MNEIAPERAKALIRGIVAKDERSLAELHRLLARRIYAFALNRLHNSDDAEIVVSDTIMEVWKHAERWDGQCKLSTWVLGIANNKVLTAWRKREEPTEEVDEQLESEDLGPFEEHLRKEEREHLLGCMQGLSVEHREALEAVFFHELSTEEAGLVLGCKPGTVKSRLYYARLGLRKCLERCRVRRDH